MKNLQIEIPEEDYDFLVNLYNERVETLKIEISKKQEQLQRASESLKKLLSASSKETKVYSTEKLISKITKLDNGYIKEWSWRKKIKFVLNENNAPMSAKEITNYIISNLEPELESEKSRIFATVSGQLSNAIKENKDFIREKNEIDEYVYSVKEEIESTITEPFDLPFK
ncbi:MAG: hypothetical protein C0459_01885 [Chitinophaga sp.]|jgi:hypothetical protein|nr:hypothetical protein [Chitinophaga sp.]